MADPFPVDPSWERGVCEWADHVDYAWGSGTPAEMVGPPGEPGERPDWFESPDRGWGGSPGRAHVTGSASR